MSNASIAKEFAISSHTVEREIDWAKRQGLVQDYEDSILTQLVPEAIKVFAAALAAGDRTVALEVLKGTGMLRKPSDKATYGTPPTAEGEESLEIHIKKVMRGGNTHDGRQNLKRFTPRNQLAPDTAAAAPGVDDGSVLEAAYVISEVSPQEIRPGGDENHDADPGEDLGVSAVEERPAAQPPVAS